MDHKPVHVMNDVNFLPLGALEAKQAS